MAREYGGDIYDFATMTDDEIREVVLEHFRESPTLDADDIDVLVQEGTVSISGRVGTDSEVEVAIAILDDVLGLDYTNELVFDELRRGEAPNAADDAIALQEETESSYGSPSDQQSDTAEHLVEDLEAETFGTRDLGKAIQDGSSYNPPDRPTSGGYGSREEH
jgi:hypothetical protein